MDTDKIARGEPLLDATKKRPTRRCRKLTQPHLCPSVVSTAWIRLRACLKKTEASTPPRPRSRPRPRNHRKIEDEDEDENESKTNIFRPALSRNHAVELGSAPAPGAAGRALATRPGGRQPNIIRLAFGRSGSARGRAERQPGRLCSPFSTAWFRLRPRSAACPTRYKKWRTPERPPFLNS